MRIFFIFSTLLVFSLPTKCQSFKEFMGSLDTLTVVSPLEKPNIDSVRTNSFNYLTFQGGAIDSNGQYTLYYCDGKLYMIRQHGCITSDMILTYKENKVYGFVVAWKDSTAIMANNLYLRYQDKHVGVWLINCLPRQMLYVNGTVTIDIPKLMGESYSIYFVDSTFDIRARFSCYKYDLLATTYYLHNQQENSITERIRLFSPTPESIREGITTSDLKSLSMKSLDLLSIAEYAGHRYGEYTIDGCQLKNIYGGLFLRGW